MSKILASVIVTVLGLLALGALFPPMRQAQSHEGAGRGFLFSPNLTRANLEENRDGNAIMASYTLVEIDSPRFAAECVFLLSLGGLTVTVLNSRRNVS